MADTPRVPPQGNVRLSTTPPSVLNTALEFVTILADSDEPIVVNPEIRVEVIESTNTSTGDSPTDGLGTSSSFVEISGDTMTGPLVLFGDPNAALVAATKQYVDNTTVTLSGDTMTGLLLLSADPTAPLGAATKQYADNASFPSGTVLLFYQSAAPTGWTKLTTQNDKALRVVSGSGGVSGGTNAFSTVMAQTTVQNWTLSTSDIGSHFHPGPTAGYAFMFNIAGGGGQPLPGGSGGGLNANTGSTGGGAAHNHGITMAIQYIDIILASKN